MMRKSAVPLCMFALAACSGSPEEAATATQMSDVKPAAYLATEIGGPKAASSAAPAPKSAVACAQSEQTLFSCRIKGGRQLAVCAARTDGGEPVAQYRFGKSEAELVINRGEFSRVPYSGGGESQIAFTNGDTRYIVFSRVIRTNFEPGEPNNPDFQDGVMVVRPGKKVLTLRCDGEAASAVDFSELGEQVTVGDEVFYPED